MTAPVLMDFCVGLALMALLAQSYGVIRQRLVGAELAPAVMGILFGLLALAEMHNAIEPFAGVLIDLGAIPVALAGAFLGWRGLVPCLLIAGAARYDLGGAGMAAGLCGLLIAGLAGLIWARKTADQERRGFTLLLGLALAMSLHLLGALILPDPLAAWVLTNASGPLFAVNLVAIPAIGAILEVEHRRVVELHRSGSDAHSEAGSGLLAPNAFLRRVTNEVCAQPLGSFAGILRIAPRLDLLHAILGRAGAQGDLPRLDRAFLSDHLIHGALACRAADRRIIVPLAAQDLVQIERILDEVSGGVPRGRSGLEFEVLAASHPAEFLHLAEVLSASGRAGSPRPGQRPLLRAGERSAVRRARIFNPAEHDALFKKADFLMERLRSH